MKFDPSIGFCIVNTVNEKQSLVIIRYNSLFINICLGLECLYWHFNEFVYSLESNWNKKLNNTFSQLY
jgi:hypothetical protein